MPATVSAEDVEQIRDSAHRLTGSPKDYDPLLELIGNARYVLLGEASHGTDEFYRARAEITKRLIVESGFTALCCSHLGDARATEMSRRGELNVGQLVRERHGREACSVGFTTYRGSVTAASDWGGSTERKEARPGLEGSYEAE